jgi:copper chaperone
MTTTYTVVGMTCAHCVRAVTEEIGAIDGVTDVAVDLPSGAVAVTSDRPLDDERVRAAVDEAGYDLAG